MQVELPSVVAFMNSQRKGPQFPAALFLLLLITASAFGQYPYPPPPPPMVPSAPPRVAQRAARVNYISGEVSIAPSATNQWTAARLYQTLTPAEYIWTGKNSRTELTLGYGFVRMSSEASVTLLALNRSMVQIAVNQGEVSLTVAHLFPGEIYEMDTPNATLTVTKSGTYTVDVYPDQDRTVVTTRKGSIVATGHGNAVTVDSGKQVVFTAKESLQHTVMKAPPKDGFEDWASVRDQRLKANRPPFGVVFGYGPYGPPPGPVWIR